MSPYRLNAPRPPDEDDGYECRLRAELDQARAFLDLMYVACATLLLLGFEFAQLVVFELP